MTDDAALKAAHARMWALGDYHRFATEQMWEHGPRLVEACGIGPGMRVLDVAAGTGNVAIRAAEAGAEVVASDLTPESLDAGRREAEARGVELEWVVADAEALPFADASFDVVTSSFGAMFAPRHRVVADELLRVCRPGGTIGLLAFTPDGLGGDFFRVLGPYAPPPPPDADPPWLWGDEAHVERLLGPGCSAIRTARDTYSERAASPEAYVDLFKRTFGPVVAIYALAAETPGRAEALDADFLAFARRANAAPAGAPAEFPYEYLRVIARRSGG